MKCFECGCDFQDELQSDTEIYVCDGCDLESREYDYDDCEDLECTNCGSPGSCPCD